MDHKHLNIIRGSVIELLKVV